MRYRVRPKTNCFEVEIDAEGPDDELEERPYCLVEELPDTF